MEKYGWRVVGNVWPLQHSWKDSSLVEAPRASSENREDTRDKEEDAHLRTPAGPGLMLYTAVAKHRKLLLRVRSLWEVKAHFWQLGVKGRKFCLKEASLGKTNKYLQEEHPGCPLPQPQAMLSPACRPSFTLQEAPGTRLRQDMQRNSIN